MQVRAGFSNPQASGYSVSKLRTGGLEMRWETLPLAQHWLGVSVMKGSFPERLVLGLNLRKISKGSECQSPKSHRG